MITWVRLYCKFNTKVYRCPDIGRSLSTVPAAVEPAGVPEYSSVILVVLEYICRRMSGHYRVPYSNVTRSSTAVNLDLLVDLLNLVQLYTIRIVLEYTY